MFSIYIYKCVKVFYLYMESKTGPLLLFHAYILWIYYWINKKIHNQALVFLMSEAEQNDFLFTMSLYTHNCQNTVIFPQWQASQVALVVKTLPANAGDIRDVGLIPGSERSPKGEHGNPLQYSCLENPMDRGAWWAAVHGIAKKLDMTEWLNSNHVGNRL